MKLQIQNLTKVFDSDDGLSVRALDDLSLEIREGELAVIMGPNGSGKSTLFRILNHQIPADSGLILLNGLPLGSRATSKSNGKITHVPQEPKTLAFPDMALEEHLLWAEMSGRNARFWTRGITASRRAKYRDLLELYGLHRLSEGLAQPLRSLSIGWQQIFVVFAAAVGRNLADRSAGTCDVLLLDEPTSALDVENATLCLGLVETLHREGRTILIATHDAELAVQQAERLCVLREGRIVAELSGADVAKLGVFGVRSLASGTNFQDNPCTPA